MRRTLSRALCVALSVSPSLVFADVTATVDGTANRKAISPLIYGSNQPSVVGTSIRLGGNRWTAYNWETNASNAGSDYFFQNDGFLATSNTPGAAVLPTLQSAASSGRATIVTVPIAGYASADKNGGGDVRFNNNTFANNTWTNGTANADYLSQRFNQVLPTKGSAFTLTPNTTDDFVYQDEFVNWVNAKKTATQQVIYNLDNEPDLWASTHAEIRPTAVTYADLIQRNVDFAKAIKSVSPDAVVMGAVNYGWAGYRTLQGAPDAANRDFQKVYLQQMKLADQTAGKRLVDVLDFHWYSEAQGLNASNVLTRIDGSDVSPGVVAARIQAPRSLWDPTYQENSWITRDGLPANDKKIRLLPRTQALIDANDPGIKMAMTEYNYGGGNHISGGLAQADALGIFGEQGLYAANYWDTSNGTSFINAAMRMYRDYDGAGSKFGDTSISGTVSDDGTASVYASIDSKTGKLTLVLINKSETAQTMTLSLAHLGAFANGKAYGFNAASTVTNGIVQIGQLADVTLNGNGFTFAMSPQSVTTIAFASAAPLPEPAAVGMVGLSSLLMVRRR